MTRSIGQPSARRGGFTLVEVMIVVAIIGILVAIGIPGWIKARAATQAKACMESQTKMDGAVDRWASDTGKGAGKLALMKDLVGNDKYLKTIPVCPVGSTGPTPIPVPPTGSTAVCPNTIADHAIR